MSMKHRAILTRETVGEHTHGVVSDVIWSGNIAKDFLCSIDTSGFPLSELIRARWQWSSNENDFSLPTYRSWRSEEK